MIHRQAEKIRPIPVPMTIDRTVSWECHDMPSHEGKLYLSPETSTSQTSRLLAYIEIPELRRPDRNEHIKSTLRSHCFQEEDVLFKCFYDTYEGEADLDAGLRALQANVMMQTGFERTPQSDPSVVWQTPRHYGGFVPYRAHPDGNQPVWAMSFEPGRHYQDEDSARGIQMPSLTFLREVSALAGASSDDILYDNYRSNLLVHYAPHHTLLTKLDVMASVCFDI